MFLRSLYLHHFRNYEEAYFEFSPSINLICGPNAQGKTTLLEAIHYLMMGRSFRPLLGAELIKHGSHSFYLEAKFSKHGVDQSVKVGFDGKERKIIYNNTALSSIASLIGIIPGVAMAPDDINLIKGSPNIRRQFLDLQIAQIDPLYVHHLTRFTRAMRQRNQLLKAKQPLTIESWEHEMSQSAAYITLQRHLAILDLQTYCQKAYHALTNEDEILKIGYKAILPDQINLADLRNYNLSQLGKHRSREMMLGYTLTGPHKDDLSMLIDDKEIRHYGSEGQQRSYVTSIHLAEWMRLKQIGNVPPLLMIDDVGLSLDFRRRQNLLDQLTDMGQVFLTATEENLLEHVHKEKRIFQIQKAKLISTRDA
ncbi:MAG: DNA replication/repair protein RecF [Parachlamydiaceae bacterium]|nr:DNA replication/repair protein RecF [Parachlamydiaceae bacterium]